MVEMACPDCFTSLLYGKWSGDCCAQYRQQLGKEVPDLTPPGFLRNPAYLFEVSRYEAIAQAGPENYEGYAESKPQERALVMRGLLEEANVTEFINVGPGFGALEDVTAPFRRVAVDSCQRFLCRIRERHPNVQCVRGVAERLPFVTGTVPCLVADSVLQSIVDRERFLYEIGRVCSPDAKLFLTVAYAWNYPRRPQNGFNVNRPDELATLFRFLWELGFSIKARYLNVGQGWVDDKDEGQYLYVMGER